MADLKGFYRQQKKKGGVTKKSSSASSKKKPSKGGSVSADSAQPPALVAHGSFDVHDEIGAAEEKLQQFDMDMRYGPCLGITRLERWHRASAMGLNPPPELGELLLRLSSSNKPAALDCLWEGRI